MDFYWKRLASTGIVSKEPVYIASITANNNGVGGGYVNIYDGESASDPAIMRLGHLKYDSRQITFNPPLRTYRGLYIAFTSQTTDVLIHYSVKGE